MKVDLEQRLINPAPGSALETARDFGIDLTLLAERLRLSPDERLRDLQRVMRALEQIRAARCPNDMLVLLELKALRELAREEED